MPTTFRPYQPKPKLLLPPDIRDWLPEDHLVHHVSDLVDGLDLTAFHTPYEGDRRRNAPYEPRMMVKLLIYGYATGVFSSRGIAKKLEEDLAFRMLAAGNFPKHRTICEFRRRHLEDFRKLFVEVIRLARELGLVSFGKLSIDGTKVRANASKRKAMSYDQPKQVIHHSDQGAQYTSYAFGKRCREAGVRPSMGSVGDAYDNAMCESFFATLECELLERHRFRNPSEARRAVFDFIEGFYNRSRRHSALGYEWPYHYEQQAA